MNGITQMITQQIAGTAIRSMASRLGLSEEMTAKAVQVAVPLIIAALARNAAQPEGAGELHDAVSKDHDGGIFDNLTGYLSNPSAANGAGILGHIFGGRQETVQCSLANETGLEPSAAGGILEMIAPMVMGAVGQEQKQNDLDAGGLTSFLNDQTQQSEAAAPDLMGSISSMLDSNKDGNVADDVSRMLGSFMK
ncbi:MAG: DUF937 domain-containing protein [Pyrinomonadaceae bacterium]